MLDKKTIIKNFQSMKPSVAFKQLDYSKLPKEVRDKMKGDLSGVSDDTLDLQFEQSTFKKWVETFADLYPTAFGIKEEGKVVPMVSKPKEEVISSAPAPTPVVEEENPIDTSELEGKIKDLETRLGVVNKMILKQPLKKNELKIRVKTIEKMIAKFKEELKNAKTKSKKKVIKKSLGGFLLGAAGGFIAGQMVDLQISRKKVRFDLGGAIEGDKKYNYSITYKHITPESAEQGDYDDTGFEVEPTIEELQDILQEAVNRYGIYSPTSYPIHAGCSFESVSPKTDTDYFEKGIEKFYDLHIKNVDGSDISLEETQFIANKLKEGRRLHWDEEDKAWWKDGGEIHSKDTDGKLVFKADTKGGKYSIEVLEGSNVHGTYYDTREYTNGSLRGMGSRSNKELLKHDLIDKILGSKKIDGINYVISFDDLGIKEYLPASEKIYDIYNSKEIRDWWVSLPQEKKTELANYSKEKAIKYVKDNNYRYDDSTIGAFANIFRREKMVKDFYESKGQVMLKDGGEIDIDKVANKLLEDLKEKGYTERIIDYYGNKVRERIQENKGKDKGTYSRYHMAVNGDKSTAIKQNGYLEENDVLSIYKNSLERKIRLSSEGKMENGGGLDVINFNEFTPEQFNSYIKNNEGVYWTISEGNNISDREKTLNPKFILNKSKINNEVYSIGDYGKNISVIKGSENIYADLLVYNQENKPFTISLFSKENHDGIKNIVNSIVEKFKRGGKVKSKVEELVSEQEIDRFIDYLDGFYGKDGIYADQLNGGFTKKEIESAVNNYIIDINNNKNSDVTWGGGDSLDRERVREYLEKKDFKDGGETDSETPKYYKINNTIALESDLDKYFHELKLKDGYSKSMDTFQVKLTRSQLSDVISLIKELDENNNVYILDSVNEVVYDSKKQSYKQGGNITQINEDGTNIPQELNEVFAQMDIDNEGDYSEMERLRLLAKEKGYDFDYDLSGTPTSFWEIKEYSNGGRVSKWKFNIGDKVMLTPLTFFSKKAYERYDLTKPVTIVGRKKVAKNTDGEYRLDNTTINNEYFIKVFDSEGELPIVTANENELTIVSEYSNGGDVNSKKEYAVYILSLGQPYYFWNEGENKFIWNNPEKATLYNEKDAYSKRDELLKPRIEEYQKTGKNYSEIHVGNLYQKKILKYSDGGDFEKALENLHSKASSSTTPRGKNKINIPVTDEKQRLVEFILNDILSKNPDVDENKYKTLINFNLGKVKKHTWGAGYFLQNLGETVLKDAKSSVNTSNFFNAETEIAVSKYETGRPDEDYEQSRELARLKKQPLGDKFGNGGSIGDFYVTDEKEEFYLGTILDMGEKLTWVDDFNRANIYNSLVEAQKDADKKQQGAKVKKLNNILKEGGRLAVGESINGKYFYPYYDDKSGKKVYLLANNYREALDIGTEISLNNQFINYKNEEYITDVNSFSAPEFISDKASIGLEKKDGKIIYKGSSYIRDKESKGWKKEYSKGGGVNLDKDKFSLTSINNDLIEMVIGEDWTAKEFKEHFLNKGYELKPDNSIVGFYFAKPDGQTFQLVPSFHKKGEIIKYRDGGSVSSDNTPKVYIADLAAYNEGKLVGEWLDLSEFGSGEEVMQKISELLKEWSKEAGEEREEYSVHDMENFPKQMYSEGMGEDSFQKVIDYWEAINGTDYPMEVVEEFASLTGEDVVDAANNMKDAYYGKFDNVEDFARNYVDSIGGIEGVSNPEQYIDISETDKRIMASEQADFQVGDMSDEDILKRANLDGEYQDAEDSEDENEMDRILEEAKESVREEIESEWENGLRDPYNFLVEEQGLYDASSIMKANFIMFDYEAFGKDLEQDYYVIEHDGEVYVFNQNYKKGGSLPSSRTLGVSKEKVEIEIPEFRPDKLKQKSKTNNKQKMAKKTTGSNKNKERMTLIQSEAKKIWAEGKLKKYSEAVKKASEKLKKEGKL